MVGLPDERWARSSPPSSSGARRSSRTSSMRLPPSRLAGFKRPRRHVFVAEIPRSRSASSAPQLVAGDYIAATSLDSAKERPHDFIQESFPIRVCKSSTASASRSIRRAARRHRARPAAVERHRDGQRDQLRLAFEALDEMRACASSCCAPPASISPAAAISPAFSRPRPSMSRNSPGTSRRRRAAPSR